jgi:hypothetical protein
MGAHADHFRNRHIRKASRTLPGLVLFQSLQNVQAHKVTRELNRSCFSSDGNELKDLRGVAFACPPDIHSLLHQEQEYNQYFANQ